VPLSCVYIYIYIERVAIYDDDVVDARSRSEKDPAKASSTFGTHYETSTNLSRLIFEYHSFDVPSNDDDSLYIYLSIDR
jgi:hypothetical protein